MKKLILFLIVFIFAYMIFLITCMCKPCGSSRWSVKTLTDNKIIKIDLIPDTMFFKDLYRFDKPVKTFYNTIRMNDEYKFVIVKGILRAWIKETDNDLHVVLLSAFSPDSTIICEIPSPSSCSEVALSPFACDFNNASKFVTSLKSSKEGRWNFLSGKDTVYVSGFLFHDFPHNVGMGHMPNFLELHPVIKIERVD
jgi:hypothetical protein